MSLFRSQTSLFNEIDCPLGTQCNLGNCLFRHSYRGLSPENVSKLSLKRANVEVDSHTPPKSKRLATERRECTSASKPPLVPRMLTSPPASHQQRTQFLYVLHEKLVQNKYENAEKMAVDLEADVAQRSTQFTYSMGIRTAVRSILSGDLRPENQAKVSQSIDSILRAELVQLLIPERELEKRRYVLEKPDPVPLESAAIVTCERCRSTFPYYDPKVRTGSCRFHLLKRQWDPSTRKLSTTFPCCGEPLTETGGCEVRDFHVYKLSQPSLMEAVIPFRETPTPDSDPGMFAAGLDCEMAWTTKGFELIRVTLLDYSSGKITYDRLVWPVGKILDLNTRFSGVSNMEDGITLEDGHTYMPLSLEDMYTEFFQYVTSKTILIGHGLENDMNAMRLIHHRIVDTAILYPRSKTRTHALRELAWTYLSRTIQTGEHDSMEDALAAIDVVKADIKARCINEKVKSF